MKHLFFATFLLFFIACYSFKDSYPWGMDMSFVINNSTHYITIEGTTVAPLDTGSLSQHILNQPDTIPIIVYFDSTLCYSFHGVISVDDTTDIRSRAAYKRSGDRWYYTITDSLYAKASSCN